MKKVITKELIAYRINLLKKDLTLSFFVLSPTGFAIKLSSHQNVYLFVHT